MSSRLLVFFIMFITHQQDNGREAVVLRKTLILRIWENLLKRRRSTLRLTGDTTDRWPLYLIEEGEIKIVVTEKESSKRNRQHWHWESLAEQTGIMTIIQCTEMAMVLHMILTVGTDQTAACRLVMTVGDCDHQTRQIQRQQQSGDDSPSSYVQFFLHESGCKVTLFYRITHVYTIKKITTHIYCLLLY